jgi:N-acetylglucosamine-6-sulfatase
MGLSNGRLLLLLISIAVLATGASGATGASRGQARPQAVAKPNILIIETDDQTLAEMEVLPNVQRLIGGQGVTFDNYFDSFSLCCPSRATLLTGQYPHNNGVRGNALPQGGYYKLESSNTLPVWLQRGGYYTIHLGKYLNGYGTRNPREIPPGWSEWHGAVDPSTYRYYNYQLNESGTVNTYCPTPNAACYQTDVFRSKAEEIIRRRTPGGPWFMWLTFLADHSGAPRDPDDPTNLATPSPAPRHRNHFAGFPLPQPPSFNEADVSDKPASIRRRARFTAARIRAIQESWQQRRESLLAVDEAVASIMATLAASGELQRTLIMFTSDNGFFHGEHRIPNGKVIWYEPSIHLPFLMRGPGIPRGVHRSQLISNIDIAPTVLAAAGVRPGRILDGVRLQLLARDRNRELGRDLLVDNTPGTGHFDAIRTRNYKYAEYATGEKEMYDLRRDPYELQSVHADPRYAALRDALAARLHRLIPCAGASCRARPSALLTARCRRRVVRAGLRASSVRVVTFYVNGRRIRSDRRRPYALATRVRTRRALVRARILFGADRLLTVDRRVRCR